MLQNLAERLPAPHMVLSIDDLTRQSSLRFPPLFQQTTNMKSISLIAPGGLDNLVMIESDDPGLPATNEIRVRIHASSLNYHDYGVVSRPNAAANGRIPMSDGAGVVEAVGADVSEFNVGDHVVSCFFPTWENGTASIGNFSTVPGDGVDGYAREIVTCAPRFFTLAPKGYSHSEAATLTTAGLTAWRALVVDGALKAGDTVLVLGTGGVSIAALQIAKAMGATVIATSSSDDKLARVRALGADHTLNYRTHPNWGAQVAAMTCHRGRWPGNATPIDCRRQDRRQYLSHRGIDRPLGRRTDSGVDGETGTPTGADRR
jgi:NADPH:quinone reductase-like Zn-dependent oxidoreductase